MPTSSQTRDGETAPERSTTRTPTLASMRHWGGSVSVVAIVIATAGGRFGPRADFGVAAARLTGAGGGAGGGTTAEGPAGGGVLVVTAFSRESVGSWLGPVLPKSELVCAAVGAGRRGCGSRVRGGAAA